MPAIPSLPPRGGDATRRNRTLPPRESPERTRLTDRAGELLAGRYRLERTIGAGGMGAVYEALHLGLGRRVAVKLLRDASDGRLRQRFAREARVAGKLDAENLVAVTDCGEAADGTPFLVMELLRGTDLRSCLEHHGALSLDRAVEIALQVCRGLETLHAAGYVHRDIKPSNLFIGRHADGSDWVKILDLGVVRAVAGVDGTGATGDRLVGTIRYMAPEQVRGDPQLDHRADVYSLAAVLYEMLAGRAAFVGEPSHVVLHDILYGRPESLAAAGIADSVRAVVERAMSRDPRDRFESADAFARALAHARTARGDDQTTQDDSWAADARRSRPAFEPSAAATRSPGRVTALVLAGVLLVALVANVGFEAPPVLRGRPLAATARGVAATDAGPRRTARGVPPSRADAGSSTLRSVSSPVTRSLPSSPRSSTLPRAAASGLAPAASLAVHVHPAAIASSAALAPPAEDGERRARAPQFDRRNPYE